MPAIMKWHKNIPIPPTMKTGFRPSLSTYITAGIVARNITMPTTPVASREVVFDD